jgi:hypothetical protein
MPSKLHAIPTLLSSYAGREAEIVGKVEQKYHLRVIQVSRPRS